MQGNAVLKANFKKNNYVVTCTTEQMLVLLAFNEREEWTVRDLLEASRLASLPVLARTLRTLLQPIGTSKQALLRPTGMAPAEGRVNVNNEDATFALNPKFESAKLRFRLPLIRDTMQVATVAGQLALADGNREQIESSRQMAIEAAIVRVLKDRRRVSYAELFQTCAVQLARVFPLQTHQFKARLDALLSREFLRRDDSDPCVVSLFVVPVC